MFDKHKLSRSGAQAQALVLEKKIYASGVESGMTSACRYQLRVKFEDDSLTEISCRVFDRTLASAAVGDVIPVRYDPADRSKIELDRHAIVERQKAQARERDAEAIARGQEALGVSLTALPSMPFGDQQQPAAGELRIGDADREIVAEVLSQHMTDGRLTTEELDDRIEALYRSQTRAQARSALAGLPPLDWSGGQRHHDIPVLPGWLSAAEPLDSPSRTSMPTSGPIGTAPVPTDGEINTAYRRWQVKAEKMKADQAAHKQAEASGDPKETARALMRLKISQGEQKSARAKLEQLRKRRPDWTADER